MIKYEGKNAIMEALNSDCTINKILISNTINRKSINEMLLKAKQKNIRINFVDNYLIKKESETKTPQGCVAFAEDFKYSSLQEILNQPKENKFLLILDGIEDPHNFGSIIRSAECFGIDGVIIGKNRSCLVTETVIRTSAGAISHIKISRETNINQTIETLKKNNFWVFGLELGGEPLNTTDFSGNIAVVVGSEGKGTSELTKKLCDKIVTLDMKGKVNSLNASVATGIGLYEISQKR